MKTQTLYYALTTYQIQCCLLHKLTLEKESEATLLLSDIRICSPESMKRYRASGVFKEIIILKEASVYRQAKELYKQGMEIKKIMKRSCKNMNSLLPVNLADYKTLYLCPDHFPFGWYTIQNKMPYYCFEEGCGVLSDHEFLLSNIKKTKVQYEAMRLLGCFGANTYAIKIFADIQAQKLGYQNNKLVDFSVKHILSSMDQNILQVVLDFFGVKKLQNFSRQAALLLTQHMANLNIMSLDSQHLLYTLFADYFCRGYHLVVKPHPDDIAGQYREFFSADADILPYEMPSELLPYCTDTRYNTAVAASSTSIKSLGSLSRQTICFDIRIHSDFKYIHQYYFACKFLKILGIPVPGIVSNANELLLKEICRLHQIQPEIVTVKEIPPKPEWIIYICSDILMEKKSFKKIQHLLSSMSENQMVIFLNEHHIHLYFNGTDTSVFQHIRPVRLYINGKDTREEVIYVYSKNKKLLDKAETFQDQIELKYTGITIDAAGISKSEHEKIKVLEGILEATETRLLEYIKSS